MRLWLVLVGVVSASGCASPIEHQIYEALQLPPRNLCIDGAPARILQDPACHYGICGYTCAPGRWLSD